MVIDYLRASNRASAASAECDQVNRSRIQAEAAASNDRVALDRMLIDQLPQIVREAANGLQGANINVLNGADGLSEIAAGLVSQGMTIYDSVRKSMSEDGTSGAGGSIVQGKRTTEIVEIESGN